MNATIEQLGSPDWPRYVVTDNKGRYFDGEDWTTEQRKALLFSDPEEAEVARRFVHNEQPPRMLLRGTVRVLVDEQDDFAVDQLRDYLQRNVHLHLEKEDHPYSEMDIDLELDFDHLGT